MSCFDRCERQLRQAVRLDRDVGVGEARCPVSFEGVELPDAGVWGGFPVGDPVPYMERNLVAGLFHAAASLGIAESADEIARRKIAGRIDGARA